MPRTSFSVSPTPPWAPMPAPRWSTAAPSRSGPRIRRPTTISALCTTSNSATVAYVNLAASHEALGQIDEALAAYRQALQHDANLVALREKIDALSKRVGR